MIIQNAFTNVFHLISSSAGKQNKLHLRIFCLSYVSLSLYSRKLFVVVSCDDFVGFSLHPWRAPVIQHVGSQLNGKSEAPINPGKIIKSEVKEEQEAERLEDDTRIFFKKLLIKSLMYFTSVAAWQGGPGGPWPPLNGSASKEEGAPKLLVYII